MELRERLFSMREEQYAQFQSKLTPTLARERFIGVRTPALRKLAKELSGEEAETFLREEHVYYEENMLHALLLNEEKDFARCCAEVERFLPRIDNWAVCDGLSPKVFARHKEELLPKVRAWAAAREVYPCRFGVGMLMRHYLDGAFREEYLEIPAAVRSEEYYVNMMLAWFYATALAKQWDATLPYLTERRLGLWVHNKTIRKARESYRITAAQKAQLWTLRRRA